MVYSIAPPAKTIMAARFFTKMRPIRAAQVIPSSIKRRTQRKLDGMVEAALAERAQLPPWRLGVIDGSSPGGNFFSHAIVHDTLAGLLVLFCKRGYGH